MIAEEKVLVLDIDGTICPIKKAEESYMDIKPNPDMIKKIHKYKSDGYYLIYYSARNMRTYQGNVGKINANTLKTLFAWMDKHNIPYDEIHVGKPWPGKKGFYVDDRCIRPDEFLKYTEEEIYSLLGNSE